MSINPQDLIGLQAGFEHHGKRLVGIVTAATLAEPWGKGKIPDFTVTVRGCSGRMLTVSLVETYMRFPDQ